MIHTIDNSLSLYICISDVIGTGNHTPLSDFVVALRIIVNNSNITGVDGPFPVIFSQHPLTDTSILRNGPNTQPSKVISSFTDLKWQPPPPFDQNKYDVMDFARVHFGSLKFSLKHKKTSLLKQLMRLYL